MTIEVRPCQVSLGYQRQSWPMTRHHIARIGRREVRLIVARDESLKVLPMVALMLVSFLLP